MSLYTRYDLRQTIFEALDNSIDNGHGHEFGLKPYAIVKELDEHGVLVKSYLMTEAIRVVEDWRILHRRLLGRAI